MLEPQKQMHAALILRINLLLAPRQAAAELSEAVGFRYLCGEGPRPGAEHKTKRVAHILACTHMHMDAVRLSLQAIVFLLHTVNVTQSSDLLYIVKYQISPFTFLHLYYISIQRR